METIKQLLKKIKIWTKQTFFSSQIRKLLSSLFILAVIAVVIPMVYLGVNSYQTYKVLVDLKQSYSDEDQLKNTPLIAMELKENLNDMSKLSKYFPYLRVIPNIRFYVADFELLTRSLSKSTGILTNITVPLTAEQSENIGFTTYYNSIDKNWVDNKQIMLSVISDLNLIDESKYPKSFFGIQVKKSIADLKDILSKLSYNNGEMITQIFKSLPETFAYGKDNRSAIIVLFLNNGELRNGGGFITNFMEITFEDGSLDGYATHDTYNLDSRIRDEEKELPANPIFKKYLEIDHFYARDSNIYPNFSENAQEFIKFYNLVNSEKVAAVFSLDTNFMKLILTSFGKIKIKETGEVLTKDNVIDKIQAQAANLKEDKNRKLLMTQLQSEIQGRVTSPNPFYALSLISVYKDMLETSHAAVYFSDKDLQQSIEKLGYSGNVQTYENDFLLINESNLAGGKANFFLEKEIFSDTSETEVELLRKVTIQYYNPKGYSILNPGYKAYLSLYIPKAATIKNVTGSEMKPLSSDSNDMKVINAYITVPPKENSEITFEYSLPKSFKENYSLKIQKQMGEQDLNYSVNIFGSLDEFKLKEPLITLP